MKDALSIIVPVLGMNDPYLSRCLASLESYLTHASEVLVTEGGNVAQARNLGLKLAQGSYIAFVDSDCEAPAGWPSSLIQHLQNDASLGGVGGPNLAHPSDPPLAGLLDVVFSMFLGSLYSASFYRTSKARVEKSLSCCNSVYCRDALLQAGGFDERFEQNEDTDLGYKVRAAGYRLLQVPDDPVWHHRRRSVQAFARQMFNYGVSRARSILTNSSFADWKVLVGPIGLAIWLLSLLVSPALAIMLLVSYLVLCTVSSALAATRHRQFRDCPFVSLLLVLEHASYLSGMIFGLFRGPWKQSKSSSILALRLFVDPEKRK